MTAMSAPAPRRRLGMEDERVEEYRYARLEVMKGLSAAPGARERYLRSIGPYLEFCAEFVPDGSPARLPYMAALAYGHEEDRGPALPLAAILFAFQADEADAEYIRTLKPVYSPEPTDEQERLRLLGKRNYSAYLRTDHWKRVREAAVARAGHRCERCNEGGPLEVHHRFYRCGAERPADLQALCAVCHSRTHDKRRFRPR